jgi:hypothetical protein
VVARSGRLYFYCFRYSLSWFFKGGMILRA